MQLVHVHMRLPVDLDARLRRRRDETGVPTTTFVRRLIEAALDKEQSNARPARPRRKAAV